MQLTTAIRILAFLAAAPAANLLPAAPAVGAPATPASAPVIAATPALPRTLLDEFRTAPDGPMHDVKQIVFAVRPDGIDSHWYANFGYYADDVAHRPAPHDGGKLCLLDLDTNQLRILLDDPAGSIRDPQVSYDASKILFAYRRGGTTHFHLYEIALDGTALRQLTDGDCDDIEPTYTADGKIIFVSTRAKRWVQCWLTPVATLHGCDADGKNIRPLSGNVEHDNTPWPLPDGKILYTRWEYVDRSQVHYHHLWTMHPDGTQQMVYYGNMQPGTVFIDAKPIPRSEKVVATFSPWHGLSEHTGPVGIIDPRRGPDVKNSARRVTRGWDYRDPWAFSEEVFMAVRGGGRLVLIDGRGAEKPVWDPPAAWVAFTRNRRGAQREQTLFSLPREWRSKRLGIQEPRPVIRREHEKRMVSNTDFSKNSGRLILSNVYEGRNMAGVKRGEIKKLLILETLPKPLNFAAGMEPLSQGGTFTLERIVGTVPVEADGSAHFELPALRAFFFVALDADNLAVKRMQSFLSLMPGEVNSCIGCHEERTAAPNNRVIPAALRRPPSPITPVADYRGRDALGNRLAQPTGIPDVIDFPRDIQPILDRYCVSCHNAQKRSGGVNLTGHRTPLYSVSYHTLTARDLLGDGRNLAQSNYPPRALGSSASRLLKLANGSHGKSSHGNAKLTPHEQTLLRLWIETGAAYPGTYAALGSGMIGGYIAETIDRSDLQWPEVKAMLQILQKNCVSCHSPRGNTRLPLTASHETVAPPRIAFEGPKDARRRFSRNLLYDLSVPADSALLLGPLAKSAGGYESCGKAVFADKNDPRYKTILAGIERTKRGLEEIRRFDMPRFAPTPQYIRELKKFGVLPPSHDPKLPADPYALDQKYWQSLWHKADPQNTAAAAPPPR
ncbi:MAG: hypothetical protein LBT53_01720 [Puniceicoccales bacterium]|jgi:hypothetical protein|nr:hypothetical protein [Puniceicoccales bacterium]